METGTEELVATENLNKPTVGDEKHSDKPVGSVGETESKSVKQDVEKSKDQDQGNKDKDDQHPLRKPGYADIKSEFLLLNYKPTLQTEYLSKDLKEKIGASKDESQTQDEEVTEPPSKKPKIKGRNKHRPRNERIEEKDKLCPAIKDARECKFGDNCKFNHDVKDFLEKKTSDLEGKCPVFETWGYCRHGVTCRYASSHLGENNENVINDELNEKMKGKLRCLNTFREEVKKQLWKKKYDFRKAIESVKEVNKAFPNANTNSKDNPVSNEKDIDSTITSSVEQSETSDPVSETNTNSGNMEVPAADPGTNGDGPSDIIAGVTKEVCSVGTDDVPIRLTAREVKKIDFNNKLFLAPLTTVGNLPFRRVCKDYGVDITCSEMALASQLLQGKTSEWSLVKRHPSEDIFGVQVCGAYPDLMTKCAQVLTETCDIDFIDINCGCPIDLVFKKGSGSALMGKATKLEQICRSMMGVMGETPLTVKLRTGVFDRKNVAHNIIPRLRDAGVSLVTIHGRSREQRYTKLANWDYIDECAKLGHHMPVFGNGDILSYEDANLHMERTGVSGVMLARGALIKPWVFTEIKEQRHWDISSTERLDILRSYTNYGLEHWGSDHQGVETTRRFLLEWLSFLHRYIPVGVLEHVPQKINERPPYYIGRNDLETLMASANCADWVKISEMLLGPVPSSFQFLPKHKANAYQ